VAEIDRFLSQLIFAKNYGMCMQLGVDGGKLISCACIIEERKEEKEERKN
jgi:hypothetical protein